MESLLSLMYQLVFLKMGNGWNLYRHVTLSPGDNLSGIDGNLGVVVLLLPNR